MRQAVLMMTAAISAAMVAAAPADGATAETPDGTWQLHTPDRAPDVNRMEGNPATGKVTLTGAAGCFCYVPLADDFQLDVRLVGMDVAGSRGGGAGVRLAEGLDEAPLRSSITYRKRPDEEGGPSRERPYWLRIVRVGRNVGVYASHDGRRYRHRPGGRTLRTDGRVYVGPALFGGDADSPMRAAFDRICLARPRLAYRTSWVGNTLPGPVEDTVSFNMTGLFAAPDGTCYTTSFFEEQGHCLAAYKDGKNVGPGSKTATAGIAITSNGTYVFASHKNGFHRLDMDLTSGRTFVEVSDEEKGHETVRGLAADVQEVFVGNRPADRIEVYDCESLKPKRRLAFARPGPMCLDADGRLWVIREGFETSTYEFLDGPYEHEAEIVCIDRQSGRVQKTVTGPEVPTGIAFDPRGRLLVADNGKDQQVKIYDVTAEPRLAGTVGTRGGMYAGTPGAVTDGKLNGLTGVGADAKGNVYVTSTGWPFTYISPGTMANATTLRAFGPKAVGRANPEALWTLESLAYIFDGATLDPKDETRLYAGADQVFRMDWSKGPGQEGTYVAFTSNLRDFPHEALGRRARCTPWVRWMDGVKFLVLRGKPGLCFYRFEPDTYGEMAVPCAAICPRSGGRERLKWPAHAPHGTRRPWIWMDGTRDQPRDGIAQPPEIVTFEAVPSGGGTRWDVDAAGDVWHTDWRTNALIRWRFAGLASGVPTWEDREVIDGPRPFVTLQRSRYDAATDTMILAGSTRRHPGHRDVRWRTTHVARYENWSRGNRKSAVEFTLAPEPGDFFMDGAVGFDVVDRFLYTTGRPGNVKVYDLRRGNRVMEFVPGVEVNGSGGYFDNSQSAVQAFRLSTGEYLALAQENGWCKVLAYRWRPEEAPERKPAIAPDLFSCELGTGRVRLRWRTGTCGIVDGYNVYRSAGDGGFKKMNARVLATPAFTDTSAANGRAYDYRVSIVNAAGEGPASDTVRCIPQQAAARFVGIDERTQGDWKGTYGRDGFYVVGDWDSPNNPTMPGYLRIDGGAFRRTAGFPPRPANGERFLLKAADGAAERASFPPGSGYRDKQQEYVLEFTDGGTHRMTLYAAGHPNGFATRIELLDASTGEVLDARDIAASGERQGRYVTWDVSGAIRLRYHKKPGGFGNFLAGFFFDPVADEGEAAARTQNPDADAASRTYRGFLEYLARHARDLPDYAGTAAAAHKSVFLEIPKLELARMGLDAPPVDERNIRAAVEFVASKRDRADFGMLGLLRVLYRYGDSHRAHAETMIRRWLAWRARFGFSEWNSGYYHVNLATLADLVDFAEAPAIRRRSRMLMDLILFHMAVHSHGTNFGCTKGRSGAPASLSDYHVPTRLVQNLLFGEGPTTYRISPFAVTLATSGYRLPPVIRAIAQEEPDELVARERHSLNVEEAADFGVDPTRPEDLWFFWGAQVWNHRLVIENSLAQCPPHHFFYGRIKRARDRYRRCEAEGTPCDPDPNHQAMTEANVYTFRTREFMLSCAQDYRKGKPGFQQHIWQATLDGNACVFATCPASGAKDHGRPGHWTGNRFMPRAAAHRNVLVCIWRLNPAETGEPVTHAFFPRWRFDECRQASGWLLGRKGDGYVALRSLQPVRWAEPRRADVPLMRPLDAADDWRPEPYEVLAEGAENVWLCELGNPALHGSFDAFVEAVAGADVRGDARRVVYDSPSLGPVTFGWTGTLEVAGKAVPLDDYPRFANPYCTAEFNTTRFEIHHDGRRHVLDFDGKF